jgi:alcohol dehydrogenase (cytochrome c)
MEIRSPRSLFLTLTALFAATLAACGGGQQSVPATPGLTTTTSGAAKTAQSTTSESTTASSTDWPFSAGDWPTYNRDLQNDRFSPLTGITTSNVTTLHTVCKATLDGSGASDQGFETGPIVVNGILYATTITMTYAFDAATCAKKWSAVVPSGDLGPLVKNALANRGVAYANGNLYRGVYQNHVIALNATTGALLWDTDLAASPMTWKNIVYIGTAGADDGAQGAVFALSQSNGSVQWRTATVPPDPAPGTTLGDSTGWGGASHPAGGSTWSSYTIDPGSGSLLVSTGNPAPDFFAETRKGSNPSTDSLLVFNAITGQITQQYQWVHGDTHDWDIAATAAFSTATGSAFVAGKDGYLRKVQLGGIGNDNSQGNNNNQGNSATLWSTPVTTVDANPAVPTVGGAAHFCPGSTGGTEWNGPAFSAQQNAVFVNTVDQCNTVTLQSSLNATSINNSNFAAGSVFNLIADGAPWTAAVDYNSQTAQPPNAPFGVPDMKRTGHVYAVDARSGSPLWHFDAPDAMLAGITATQGGLVFTADLRGNFYAFNAKNGTIVKSIPLGQPVGGGVITYLANLGNKNQGTGTQYVAVMAGMSSPLIWHTSGTNQIIVLGI